MQHAVVVGDTEVARRTCTALSQLGYEVTHLPEPTDAELRAALVSGTAAVAVLIRGDVTALRYSLLVEHLLPRVRLVVTLFDRTIAKQLVRVVPNCSVTSPADVAVPSIIGACLKAEVLALDHSDGTDTVIMDTPDGVMTRPWRSERPMVRSVLNAARRQFRPHDGTTRMLLIGVLGLMTTLVADWVLTISALREHAAPALYAATRVVATVGPGNAGTEPAWYLVISSVFMLLTIGFTALFTAGLVNRSVSARSIGIVGPRTMPRADHVVVVGLGQVGLRLCMRLRELKIPVIAVERDPDAPNLRLAKAAKIPVLIAHAEDRAVLDKLSLRRARAFAAMGSDDRDNVEVTVAALAVAPDLRVVLRAGDDDVIAETRSLFHIGQVSDVSALTAHAVTLAVSGEVPRLVYMRGHQVAAFPLEPSANSSMAAVAAHTRCAC